jgi:hypothetical protein
MTKTEQHARPKLHADLSFDQSAKHGTITWVTAIEGGRLWADLADRLQQAERTVRVEPRGSGLASAVAPKGHSPPR